MPELPEVETTRRGIEPHLLGHTVTAVSVRQPKLRWPVPKQLGRTLKGRAVNTVERRAKYLLLRFDHGTLILHLGMSGSLRLVPTGTAPGKHDHVDLELDSGQTLRLTDPRRFGAVLWCKEETDSHPLLASLGPEPLSEAFNLDYLLAKAKGKRATIKQFIMDGGVVVGVGNIYASEALFLAGIHPKRAAGRISHERMARLVEAIKTVLAAAIEQGGTTLRDFVGGDGKPGYFAQQLNVYGREGEPCPNCRGPIKKLVLGQRASYFCPHCQR